MTDKTPQNSMKERNKRKALLRSQRNTAARNATNAQDRRRERRRAARTGAVPSTSETRSVTRSDLERMKVAELRKLCEERGIKTNSRLKKKDLIEMLAGRGA